MVTPRCHCPAASAATTLPVPLAGRLALPRCPRPPCLALHVALVQVWDSPHSAGSPGGMEPVSWHPVPLALGRCRAGQALHTPHCQAGTRRTSERSWARAAQHAGQDSLSAARVSPSSPTTCLSAVSLDTRQSQEMPLSELCHSGHCRMCLPPFTARTSFRQASQASCGHAAPMLRLLQRDAEAWCPGRPPSLLSPPHQQKREEPRPGCQVTLHPVLLPRVAVTWLSACHHPLLAASTWKAGMTPSSLTLTPPARRPLLPGPEATALTSAARSPLLQCLLAVGWAVWFPLLCSSAPHPTRTRGSLRPKPLSCSHCVTAPCLRPGLGQLLL